MSGYELTVDVCCKPTLETAERCLKLLEWFMNDNPDLHIQVERLENEKGYYEYYQIVKRGGSRE